MKLEHFGMAEPGDCRLVFTAGAEELAAAVAQVQAEPDAPQEEDGLLTEAVNRTILGGFSALYEQLVQEYHVVPVTDPDFELLAVNRAEGFRAGRSSTRCRRWKWEHTPVSCSPLSRTPSGS